MTIKTNFRDIIRLESKWPDVSWIKETSWGWRGVGISFFRKPQTIQLVQYCMISVAMGRWNHHATPKGVYEMEFTGVRN